MYHSDAELQDALKIVAKHGRYGDTEFAHISKDEAAILKALGGAGSINPKTGHKEYFWQFIPMILQALGGLIGGGGGAGLMGLINGAGGAAAGGAAAGGAAASGAASGTALSAGMAGEVGGAVGKTAASSFGDRFMEALGNRIIDSVSGKTDKEKDSTKDSGPGLSLSDSKVGGGKSKLADTAGSSNTSSGEPKMAFSLETDGNGGLKINPANAPKADVSGAVASAAAGSNKKITAGKTTGTDPTENFNQLLNQIVSGQLFQRG